MKTKLSRLSKRQLSDAMRHMGKRGGMARKAALTPERRREIAILAQQSRVYIKSK